MSSKVMEFGSDENFSSSIPGASFLNSAFDDILSPEDEEKDVLEIDDDENLENDFEIDSDEDDDTFVKKSTSKSSTKQNTKSASKKEDDDDEKEDDDDENDEDDDESNTKNTNSEDDDDLNNYSNAAILAMSLKESPIFEDVEIPKNMKAKDLQKLIEEKFNEKLEEEVEAVEMKYESAAQYLEYIIKGGTPDIIQQAMELKKIANIDIEEVTSDRDLAYITMQMLYRKGYSQDDAKDLVEKYADKNILKDKAEESIEFHKSLDDKLIKTEMNRLKQQQELIKEREEEKKNKVKSTIDKGIVKGLPLKDKKGLYAALYEPTEVIQYKDQEGNLVKQKTTKYAIKHRDFQNDVEQQVAFAYLLLNDFDFTDLVEKVKTKVNKEIINVIDEKPNKRKNSSYFD